MDRHALAILEAAESWNWPFPYQIQKSGEQIRKFKALTAKLLFCCIDESTKYSESKLVNHFWETVKLCDTGFAANIESLKDLPVSVSPEESVRVLFQGINREDVDFTPVFGIANELFTHLLVAFHNPGGPKSATGTPCSVSDYISQNTEALVAEAKELGFGKRKQAVLKALSIKRDGYICALTNLPFNPENARMVVPILSHVIPNSVHGKPDTLKCIAMLAGERVSKLVVDNLNGIGNVMNLEWNASAMYDDIHWTIEVDIMDDGKVVYIYRKFSHKNEVGPGLIQLKDGDEIPFGRGVKAGELGSGPSPVLCNLQYAVARILRMSGAAEAIAQLKDDADDSDFPHDHLASKDFANILTAKLLLNSGQVLA